MIHKYIHMFNHCMEILAKNLPETNSDLHLSRLIEKEIEATSESDDREQFDTGLEDFSGEPDAPPDAGAPGA